MYAIGTLRIVGRLLRRNCASFLTNSSYSQFRLMASGNSNKCKVATEAHDKEDALLSDVFNLTMKMAVSASRNRDNPVVRFKTPEVLERELNFGLSTDGVDNSELLHICEKVFENSVLVGHPRFFNQQFAGLDSYGLAANIVLDALNVNGHTFEVAPVLTMTELAVLKHMQKFVGYEDGEGVFCPGGTYSNMLAFNVARIKRFPESKAKGLYGLPKIVTFCSQQAHYSAQKNAALLGYGEDSCVAVKCDSHGKMIPEELERKIVETKNAGNVPLLVTATAGTTVLGAFDPFNKIADVCQKHGVWMHVDGAWGGSALVSKKHRHLCAGVERSDSFAWNPHKLLCAPVTCSALFVKQKGLLNKSHSLHVPYLFQVGKPYDESYDIGRKLVQCGRRSDGFKLWFMWKAKGDSGFEKVIDRAMDNAQHLIQALKKRPNFRVLDDEPEFSNVTFWYIPPSLRGRDENEEFYKDLAKIVPIIKHRMQKKGTVLVGFSPVADRPTFFRMTCVNEKVSYEDMDFVLDEIERCGADL
ncbi:cysteine sulfinic acid decarboxylase-like isoform X3 [Clavelina lepadiformis]|uniref:Glutamate decarboxylase n=2 Tax=Clavelina lepadiformis TaxID=159417 RepID=A0ABP0FGT8_CLALP